MNQKPDALIINRDALIQAALEMEKQATLSSLRLWHCRDQLASIQRDLEEALTNYSAEKARGIFLNMFLTDAEWEKILTNQRIAQWQREFEASLPGQTPLNPDSEQDPQETHH